MRDVGVGEEPQLDLGPVDVGEESAQAGVGRDDRVERERIVD